MSLILNIDTAVQTSSVCLASSEKILGFKINPSQKDSAAWLHVAIKELLEEQKILLNDVKAIAISEGPGSYTGLRVGMSAAKGFCYALNIPLVMVSTLQMMASAGLHLSADLYCPMIDARRMEIFTAVYDKSLKAVLHPQTMVINENSFSDFLENNRIVFFGNGSAKFKGLIEHANADFQQVEAIAKHMVSLSLFKYKQGQFSPLVYAEPFYGKDFHSSSVK